MLCSISFMFLLLIVSQLESDIITIQQAIIYAGYGLLMFYYTSKPYWTESQGKRFKEDKKKRTNQDDQSRN